MEINLSMKNRSAPATVFFFSAAGQITFSIYDHSNLKISQECHRLGSFRHNNRLKCHKAVTFETGGKVAPGFKENSVLPQPFDDAGLGDLPVQECWYRYGQEDKERIDHQHGPHNKAIGEKPNPTGNSPHDYYRKQNAENSRCEDCSHCVIQPLKRKHTL